MFCRRIAFVQDGLSASTPAPSKRRIRLVRSGEPLLTKGNENWCTRVGVIRWPDHKGKRYAALRTCGFECCKRIQWLAPPEGAMCDWNGNREFNKSPACSGLRIELSENQSEFDASFGQESTFLHEGKRNYSRLMRCND